MIEKLTDPQNARELPRAVLGIAGGVYKYLLRPAIADGLKRILPIKEPESWEDRFFED